MRGVLILIVAMAAAAVSPAFAQQNMSRAESADRFMRACVRQVAVPTPAPACGCMLGHYAAGLTDRQIALLARMFEGFASGASFEDAMRAITADGYTQDEIDTMRGIITRATPNMTATCAPLERFN